MNLQQVFLPPYISKSTNELESKKESFDSLLNMKKVNELGMKGLKVGTSNKGVSVDNQYAELEHNANNEIDNYSKYLINMEFNKIVHPYNSRIVNNSRFPKESFNDAIFVNYTTGFQKTFGSIDGVQYFKDNVSVGDLYFIIPPTENWLVDRNLNYFSRIIPPNNIRSLQLSFKYDSSLKKNVMEEKSDAVIVPSIDMLDGFRVTKYRPTTALAYLQPPYIESPDADMLYQSNNYYEGFVNVDNMLNTFVFILFIILVVVCSIYYSQEIKDFYQNVISKHN